MSSRQAIIDKGKEVVAIEARAVAAFRDRIGAGFADAVELILKCKGRVIITGVGKSGIIARKIVATMNSTGTPAFFLHPSDAVHGDLGMVRHDDVVVCISKSGDTPELHELVPMFKRLGVPLVSLVGKLQSRLVQESDIVLDASVQEEACPHDLAPTSSTTATLALGDALAIALLEQRKFSEEEFAFYHPGGTLGKRLLLKIDELMVRGDAVPRVTGDLPLRDAIFEMTTKRLGCTCVVRQDGTLEGILTDGDLRRLLQRTSDITKITAAHAMSPTPKTIASGSLAVVALQEMESYNITQLVVVDPSHRPVGVVHLHDLVKAGLGGEEGMSVLRMIGILMISLVVLAEIGCGEKIRPSVVAVNQVDIPSQESWNSTVTFTDSGKVKAILWAGHIASYSPQQMTLLSESIHVDFFNEFEEHTSLLTARRGKVNDRTQDFAAYEHVVIISDSGTTLRTDSIYWDNATRKIRTEAFVDIISPTEHIMGHGMISDQGLKKYTIFKVTGQAVTKEMVNGKW